jgi:hypothetical protein
MGLKREKIPSPQSTGNSYYFVIRKLPPVCSMHRFGAESSNSPGLHRRVRGAFLSLDAPSHNHVCLG